TRRGLDRRRRDHPHATRTPPRDPLPPASTTQGRVERSCPLQPGNKRCRRDTKDPDKTARQGREGRPRLSHGEASYQGNGRRQAATRTLTGSSDALAIVG